MVEHLIAGYFLNGLAEAFCGAATETPQESGPICEDCARGAAEAYSTVCEELDDLMEKLRKLVDESS